MKIGSESPWGVVDFVNHVSKDVTFVCTSSHGGYCVTGQALDTIKGRFPAFRTFVPGLPNGVAWFEEDCDWCVVALALPNLFPADAQESAQRSYDWITKNTDRS